jgi:ABC-type sugar transport system permease subunit
MTALAQRTRSHWNLVMAGTVMSQIPMLVAFLIAQRCWAFVTPALVLIAVFMLIPIGWSLLLSRSRSTTASS